MYSKVYILRKMKDLKYCISVVISKPCHDIVFFMLNSTEHERDTCIKGLIWPPLELKTENCFSQNYFDWFTRRMTEV